MSEVPLKRERVQKNARMPLVSAVSAASRAAAESVHLPLAP